MLGWLMGLAQHRVREHERQLANAERKGVPRQVATYRRRLERARACQAQLAAQLPADMQQPPPLPVPPGQCTLTL